MTTRRTLSTGWVRARAALARNDRAAALRHKHMAFTLIELLVVIAILALLLALLTPSLAQAKLLAIKAKCQGTEHALGVAMIAYLNEYERNFPYRAPRWMGSPSRPCPVWPEYTSRHRSWHDWDEGLGDFIGTEPRNLRCQGALDTGFYVAYPDRRDAAWPGTGETPLDDVPTYAANRTIIPWDAQREVSGGVQWDRCARKLQRVQFPHRTWLFMDGHWRGPMSCVQLDPYTEPFVYWKSHFDGANVTYLDGSVRWVHWEEYLHWRDWPGGYYNPPRNEEFWAAMRSWHTMWD
mgnify:CR=1 FL=1